MGITPGQSKEIRDALACFFPEAESVTVSPHGSGLIQRSYRADIRRGETATPYLLQQFNTDVFPQPAAVAANIGCVYRRLSGKDFPYALLRPVYAPSGNAFFMSESGDYWRVFEFFEHAFSIERVRTPREAFLAGQAFGVFSAALQDIPADLLCETIPGFHDSTKRWEQFLNTVSADPAGRARSVQPETDFLHSRSVLFFDIRDLDLPPRIAHNDAKIGNVLFDKNSGEVLAVIDWDTLMPGSMLADFGDLARSSLNPLEEDDPRLESVQVQLPFFEALCRGFLPPLAALLTPVEKAHLVAAAQWITLEQALRFLSDYIAGDVYYPVRHVEHNLIRARNQLALFQSMEKEKIAMSEIVVNCLS